MQLNDPKDIITYVMGGHATFTLESVKTGAHVTYKTEIPSKPELANCRFVSFLSGPDNTSDYRYLGMCSVENDRLRFWTTKASPRDGVALAAFTWFAGRLTPDHLPEQLRFMHSGKCCRCGRELTTPESIAAGIGPVCATKEI